MYEINQRVRYSEVGADGKLTLLGVLNYFQDCTNFDSQDLGIGLWWLLEHNLGWILLTWKIEVKRYPKMGENIIIGTFPYDFKGSFGYRNFYMKTQEGEVLACADSMWMLMDLQTKQSVRISDEMLAKYELEEKYPMEYSRKKIVLPAEAVKNEPFAITMHDLDTNQHVNNGQYIAMAQPYVGNDFGIAGMRVEYRNQAFLGDMIYPRVAKTSDEVLVSLENEERIPYATLRFTKKQ